VLPIHFELMDGTRSGSGATAKLTPPRFPARTKTPPKRLYRPQNAVRRASLDDCAAHWSTYRTTHPRSKLLVVTANIEDAKKYVDHLYKGGIRAAIATSDDSAQAARNIEYFKTVGKRRSLDALVTVAMAYEGLDVPAVTHIACLDAHSFQAVDRADDRARHAFRREAGPWEEQMAYIYVPDDRNMCGIIAGMQDEQVSAIKQLRSDEKISCCKCRRSAAHRASAPRSRRWAARAWGGAGTASGTYRTRTRTARAKRSARPASRKPNCARKSKPIASRSILNFYDRKWGETNKRVVKYFGKPRTAMTLKELQRVMAWLEGNYPTGKASSKPSAVSPSPAPTVSRS
jgi:hypothetical protein